jgi:hypothetical protein
LSAKALAAAVGEGGGTTDLIIMDFEWIDLVIAQWTERFFTE